MILKYLKRWLKSWKVGIFKNKNNEKELIRQIVTSSPKIFPRSKNICPKNTKLENNNRKFHGVESLSVYYRDSGGNDRKPESNRTRNVPGETGIPVASSLRDRLVNFRAGIGCVFQ